MRLSAVAFFMILTTVFLSGCEGQKLADLDDRGGNFYGRNGVVAAAGAVAPRPAPAVVTQNQWQWPVQGRVTGMFGQKSGDVANEGIVIAAAEGTPIRAAQAGEVVYVGRETKTYGNIVILRHADGDMSSYAHAREIAVSKGDRVAAGEVIGSVGQSGDASEPQLHFAVREGKTSIDPLSKLPRQVASR